MRSSAERYRAPRLLAKLRAWTICVCCTAVTQVRDRIEWGARLVSPVTRELEGVDTHQFNDLPTDDILYEVHGLRRGILDLTKNEHLKPRGSKGRLEVVSERTGFQSGPPSGISLGYTCTPSLKPSLPKRRLLESEWG